MDINDIYRPVEQGPVAPVKRPGGKKAISVIISIFLFVGMLGLLLLVLARQIGTKSTIKTAIKEMDIANLMGIPFEQVFNVKKIDIMKYILYFTNMI